MASSSSRPPATPAISAATEPPASLIPAYDPYVIAAGASDSKARPRHDDVVAAVLGQLRGLRLVQEP